jgi:hypothetical protein
MLAVEMENSNSAAHFLQEKAESKEEVGSIKQ